jgi:very-short-patch-repair endonuclease
MILTKFVETKIGGMNVNHYRNLGYTVKHYQVITVPVEHLPEGSHERIDVLCDFCNKPCTKVYKNLMLQRKNSITKKDCCKNCIHAKDKETNMLLYGVENPMQRESIREKLKDVFMNLYGVDNPTKDAIILKKAILGQKNMSKDEKAARKERTRKTVFEKYGVDYVLQLDKTRKNLFLTRSAESSQQKQVSKMLKDKYGDERVSSNFHLSGLSLDVRVELEDVLIDVEYDSWYWHDPKRDRRRDEFLKSMGYKILRIKSSKHIPDKDVLFAKLEKLASGKNSFSAIVLDDWNEEGYRRKKEDA